MAILDRMVHYSVKGPTRVFVRIDTGDGTGAPEVIAVYYRADRETAVRCMVRAGREVMGNRNENATPDADTVLWRGRMAMRDISGGLSRAEWQFPFATSFGAQNVKTRRG